MKNYRKMKIFLSLATCFALILQACAQGNNTTNSNSDEAIVNQEPIKPKQNYTIQDFLNKNEALSIDVDAFFKTLDDTAIVAQLIMPAVGKYGQTVSSIESNIKKRQIGGVLMLNGTEAEFTKWISGFNKINELENSPKFLYSADAEPSLFNMKIKGTPLVKKATEITSLEDVTACADTIAKILNRIGINYNFAPVVDVSKNATVGYRGFGKDPLNNVPWSNEFIARMQKAGIIGTAKHFPGHGLVSGDTHESLQSINGELKEIPTYPGIIEKGVLSIMIGHLAVVNNPKYETKGLPATCSKVIITDLLRNELSFKGLIVTDAMNMGGVAAVKNNATLAIEAGCDILLMPLDAAKAHAEILAKYRKDPAFKSRVDESAKRVLRMKLCVID
jgi:beta-N-acetylhexosaminidase